MDYDIEALTQADSNGPFTRIDLGTLWTELTSGRVRVVTSFSTDERLYVALSEPPFDEPLRPARPDRNQEILERALLGQAQKVVANEFDCSLSTITSSIKAYFHDLGLYCGYREAPVLLVMAVHARHGRTGRREARMSLPSGLGPIARIVSVPRPEVMIRNMLSASEYGVLRLRMDGRQLVEIANLRRVSVRTVANQIGSAYKKVGVSGRMGLVCRLVTTERSPQPAALT